MDRLIEQLGQLPPRVRLLMGAALVGLAVFVGWALGLKEPLTELQRQREILAREQSAAEEGLPAQIAAARARVQALEERLRTQAPTLPPSETASRIIGRLGQISERHGVSLVGVNPGQARATATYRELSFKLDARGSYRQLSAWLPDVQAALAPMVITRFELNAPRPGVPLEASVRISAYGPPEPRDAGEGAARSSRG